MMHKLSFVGLMGHKDLHEFPPVLWPVIPRINETVSFCAPMSGTNTAISGKVLTVGYLSPAITGSKFVIRVLLADVKIELPPEHPIQSSLDVKNERLLASMRPGMVDFDLLIGQVNYLGKRYRVRDVKVSSDGRITGLETWADPVLPPEDGKG